MYAIRSYYAVEAIGAFACDHDGMRDLPCGIALAESKLRQMQRSFLGSYNFV